MYNHNSKKDGMEMETGGKKEVNFEFDCHNTFKKCQDGGNKRLEK